VWQTSADALLTGPLALAPLAPDVTLDVVPDVLRQVTERASRESNPETTDRLLTAIGLLLRLRYGPVTASDLISQIPEIREMDPFKKFVDEGREAGRAEGRAEGLQTSLLVQGREKFGIPRAEQEAALKAITDPARLEALCKKLLHVNTWDELLAGV
jgi:hypothetical protein